MSTLSEIEKRLETMYKKSRKDIASSWIAYMNRAAVRLQKLQDEYDAAKQSGDADEIRRTGIRLANAKRMATIYNDKYKDMVKQTTEKLADLNSIALAYVNGQIPEIYYRSYNAIRTDAIKMGIDFTIINQDVIRKRVMEDNIKTPYMHLQKFLDIPKDERWNTKQLNSAVLQGILQGESMGKIAQRIYPIVNRNGAAAIRNARTMVTGAENSGRLDSYKQLEDDGVVLNKVWMSTPDGRTRDEHVDMDGEEVGIHDKFSNGCEYPGDPAGDPATVYNCRCTMVTHIIGFKKADGSISKVKYDKDRTIHDEQMEAEKERRADKVQKQTKTQDEQQKQNERAKRGQLETPDNPKHRKEMLISETGISSGDADKALKIFGDFFTNSYHEFTDGERVDDALFIDDILSKMAIFDGEISRGMKIPAIKIDEFMDGMQVGNEFAMKSIASWTSNPETSLKFSDIEGATNSIILHCTENKSSVGVRHLSTAADAGSEAEVMSPTTAKWRVVKIEEKDKTKKTWKGETPIKAYHPQKGWVQAKVIHIYVEEI